MATFLEHDRSTLGNALGTSLSIAPTGRTWAEAGCAVVFMVTSSSADITGSSVNGYTWTHQVDRGTPGAYHIWTTPIASGLNNIDFTGTWTGNKGADISMFMFYGADATKFHSGSTVVASSTPGDSTLTIQIPSEGNNGVDGVAVSYWYATSLNNLFGGGTGPTAQTYPATETSVGGFDSHNNTGVGTYVCINPGYEFNSLLTAHSSTLTLDPTASVATTFRGIRYWLGDLRSAFQDSWQMI